MKCKFVNGTKDNLKEVCDKLGARGKMDLGPVITTVQGVIDDIRARGDEAVLEYTKKFDKAELTPGTMKVTADEIKSAYASLEKEDPDLLSIMKTAAENIRLFHEKQKEEGFMMDTAKGSKIGVRVRPITVAGVYVPGGTAPLPSTVLMDVIPLQLQAFPGSYSAHLRELTERSHLLSSQLHRSQAQQRSTRSEAHRLSLLWLTEHRLSRE